ncbi:MAG: hypothetical protein JSS07_01585 [Proteobacteria bacterium]|nr:hypothetical protein [Pseudomonadota bacterium]
MRNIVLQELNIVAGGVTIEEFASMTMFYGSAVGTAAGALAGAAKIAMELGVLYTPLGFMAGGLMGAGAGIGCGAILVIPLSAIFCPPDYAKLFAYSNIS